MWNVRPHGLQHLSPVHPQRPSVCVEDTHPLPRMATFTMLLYTCKYSLSYAFLNICAKMQTRNRWPLSHVSTNVLSSVLCVNVKSQRCFTGCWFLIFRLVHVGKALQDQRWLLQNLMARVDEKRSAVESTAKQIQGRWGDTPPIPPPQCC